MDVACERGHDDPARRQSEDFPRPVRRRARAVKPGLSALVVSDISRSTPLLPSSANRCIAVGRQSMGVWSSLKSPVWTTVPTGVWMPKPTPSGMLWRDLQELDPERPQGQRLRAA